MADCAKCKTKADFCCYCDDGSEFEPQTNADRIRSMTDEELAEFLVSIEKDTKNYRTWDSAPCCLLWLKSEVKE